MELKSYLKKAQKEKWAIGQFNFSTLEVLKAEVLAAKEKRAPVILGTSEKESQFFGLKETAAIIKALRKIWPFIFLNLDHGKSLGYIKKAIESGYDAVHFDGSLLSLKENIKIAKAVVKLAKKGGVLVEGEVGVIAEPGKKGILTEPAEALRFVEKTKVDSLAISVGNVHGMEEAGKISHLDLERLKEIKETLKNKAFFVLHGGSGTPEGDIKDAIRFGITKININTEIRMALTDSLKKILQKKEIKPYKYLPFVIEEVKKIVENKIELFGSKNKA